MLSADFDGNGRPDLLVSKMAGDGGVDHYVMYGGEGAPVRVTGISRSPYRQVIGAGYFSSTNDSALGAQTRRQVDLLFQTHGPGSPVTTYNFALSTSVDGSGNVQYASEIALPLPVASWSFSGLR